MGSLQPAVWLWDLPLLQKLPLSVHLAFDIQNLPHLVAVKKILPHNHYVVDDYFLFPLSYVDFGNAVFRIDLVIVNHANLEVVHPAVYTEINCFLFVVEVENSDFPQRLCVVLRQYLVVLYCRIDVELDKLCFLLFLILNPL
jgi:hypothetical protein